MAQASQCSQFLPSKDEEQSRAMYVRLMQYTRGYIAEYVSATSFLG